MSDCDRKESDATSLGAALFAEQGALIPHGVSPMVRLHQDEIVLPAGLSQGLQAMIAQNGAISGRSSSAATQAGDPPQNPLPSRVLGFHR